MDLDKLHQEIEQIDGEIGALFARRMELCAAIAREIADITIAEDDLHALVTLRRLSTALMDRIHGNYRRIVGFNSALILLGMLGLLPPATTALLHNGSTIAISLKSMKKEKK